MEVMQTLRSKVPLPVFHGKPGEDPITFRKKALDYMEDANIPLVERTNAFKLCLDGKARQWYEITVPFLWDDLMTLFCGRFCIYGCTQEEWYDAWQRLTYDRVNGDIEDFLSDVKQLAQLNDINDQMVLSKLKQIFPEKEDIWMLVHDVNQMYQHLRHLYSPYKRKQQATAKNTSGANPFSNMESVKQPYVLNVGEKVSKEVTFNEYNSLENTIEKLTTAIGKLNSKKLNDRYDNPQVYSKSPRPRGQNDKNFKPYITKGRDRFQFKGKGDTNPRRPRSQSYPRDNSRNRSPSAGRDRTRGRPPAKFDRSPTTRKPRSSSRPVNKDKDRCFRCHQYGHFANDCPEAQKALVAQVLEILDSPRVLNSAAQTNQNAESDYDEMIAQLAHQDLNQ